jgi:hypothetical protein
MLQRCRIRRNKATGVVRMLVTKQCRVVACFPLQVLVVVTISTT